MLPVTRLTAIGKSSLLHLERLENYFTIESGIHHENFQSYSGICCAIDPLGRVIAESKGRAGCAQNVTVTLDESILRSYYVADVPSMRNRRAADYKEPINIELQKTYTKNAAAFTYNAKKNIGIAPLRK